jgi:hypothetical protein
MTIAAGFVCSDGLVLCADTQYSSAAVKVSRTKLWQAPSGRCAIAAAGDEVLMKEVAETILAMVDGESTLEEAKEAIEQTMESIYTRHIDPSNDPNYVVQVLVAIHASDGAAIFGHSRWAATAITRAACIGTGEVLGNYVLDRLWGNEPRPSMAASIVAAHLLQVAKKHDPWCGLASEIVVLPNVGRAYLQSPRNIQNLEQFFDSVDVVLKPLLFAIPDSRNSADVIEDRLQRFCEGIRATRPFPFDVTFAITGVSAEVQAGRVGAVVTTPVPPSTEPDR